MPVHKRKYRSGKVVWYFMFDPSGSTRQNRDRISESGFSSKREAEDAEARRRVEEQQMLELEKAGVGVAAKPPTTLATLLEEFFVQHVDDKLARKTVERYHEQAAYLDPELLNMPLGEITPLHGPVVAPDLLLAPEYSRRIGGERERFTGERRHSRCGGKSSAGG